MCLVVIAIDRHPAFRLIVAANRDEFHKRPTREAHWWPDRPDVLGGRDLLAGGTWLAVNRAGRIALVTNDRDAEPKHGKLPSRGMLVAGFLTSGLAPMAYFAGIDASAYAGFNLIAGSDSLAWLSNRNGAPQSLAAGLYGLSNAQLDTPWDKVRRSKERLARLIDEDRVDETALLKLLADRDRSRVDEVEAGSLPFKTAHAITAPFVVTPDYGTRCSTIVTIDRSGHWGFLERRFDAAGNMTGESRFAFDAGGD
ncbi:MAG: NRDE family protein [Woeseiaceae bacterium]